MAKLTFKGLREYEEKLSELSKDIGKIAGAATYNGAQIIADEIKAGIDALPIVHGHGTQVNPLPGGVTESQKRGLQESFGISPLQNDLGYYNVKIGFDGYNDVKTTAYPRGQPNQLVARGTESGTSWKQKHPFVRPAITRARKRAEKKMEETILNGIDEVMKGR